MANVCLDAHAHIIENGHKRQLELDGSASIVGKDTLISAMTTCMTIDAFRTKRYLSESRNLSCRDRTCSMIRQYGSKEWVGIRRNGPAQHSPPQ